MHITKVELENIKSHENFSRDFQSGTTAITGRNGAGKTTIIEAVAWTLFDLLDYKKDDFLRRGAKKGTARVTFESHLDNRRYTVYRDTGTGYYVYDPELKSRVAEKKTDVSNFLRQHLGVEPGTDLEELFRSAIGVPQGTLTADFLMTPAARKPKFDRLLKVEEYREGAEKLKATLDLIKQKRIEVGTRIAIAESDLAKFEATHAEHREILERIAALEAEAKTLDEQITEKTGIVAELDRAQTRLDKARHARDRTEIELDARRREQHRFANDLEAAREALRKQQTAEPDYHAHLAARAELNRLEEQRRDRDHLEVERRTIEKTIFETRVELKSLEENLARAVAAKTTIETLRPLVARQQQLEDERESLRTIRAEAVQARREYERLGKLLEERRRTHKDTNARMREAERSAGAKTEIPVVEVQRKKIEDELLRAERAVTTKQALEPQRRQLRDEIEALRAGLQRDERAAANYDEIASRAAETIALNNRAIELTGELARLGAKLQQDERFRREVKNGLCPILSQKCLNLRPHETLESYFRDEFANNSVRLETLEREHQTVAASLVEAREAERQIVKLDGVRNQIQEKRENLIKREEHLRAVENEIRSFNGYNQDAVRELRARKSQLEEQLEKLHQDAEKHAELEGLRQCLKEIVDEGTRLKNEQTKHGGIAETLPKIETELTNLENDLRRLDSPREQTANLKREAARESDLGSRLDAARNGLARQNADVARLTEQIAVYNELDAQLADNRRERERSAAGYQVYLENQTLADSLPVRETDYNRITAEVEKLIVELDAIISEYQAAENDYDKEQHDLERFNLVHLREKRSAVEAELRSERAQGTRLGEELERLNRVREAMRAEFQEKERLDKMHETTDFIRDTLKKAAPEVAKVYLYSISQEANQLFREITGSAERTLRWTEDYEITLEEAGHDRPFASLSGGEQMAAALSVRLALLKQLSDVRVAFFDEPTTNLDRERRERLAEQIGHIRNFDQLFVISHDDTFEDTVDHTVNVGAAKAAGEE